MQYRIFTDNEKNAIAMALMVFLREITGKSRKSKTLLPLVEKALEGGLFLDELFNKQNYLRAASVISNITPDDYITLMLNRGVACLRLKEEESWCDDMDNMALIAKCFHDFYISICPKGGTWSTDNARINLEKAIKLNSLQALMSEECILKAGEMTCFNYIREITRHQIDADNRPSEQQEIRQNRDMEYDLMLEQGEPSDVEPQGLHTEPEPAEPDESLIADFEEMGSLNANDNAPIDISQLMDDDPWQDDAFVSMISPREMKRAAILAIVYNYMMEELTEIMTIVPGATTLADFVEKLTDGQVDVSDESLHAKAIHQSMNADLLPAYINSIRMQGMDIDEQQAALRDLLVEKWDMRDEKVRKAHKLKTLIYTHGDDDADLLACIPDIEMLYLSE